MALIFEFGNFSLDLLLSPQESEFRSSCPYCILPQPYSALGSAMLRGSCALDAQLALLQLPFVSMFTWLAGCCFALLCQKNVQIVLAEVCSCQSPVFWDWLLLNKMPTVWNDTPCVH